MLVSREELTQVAAELDAGLRGAVVQKAYSPVPEEVWLELRLPGKSTLLCICVRAGSERYAVSQQRPESPKVASGFQQLMRKRLVGARLSSLTFEGLFFEKETLRVSFEQHRFKLEAQLNPPVTDAATGEHAFPLARALQTRVGEVVRTDARAALDSRVAALKRTRKKVEAEASRGEKAEQMRDDGELLSRNLHAVGRGAATVTLTAYGKDGSVSEHVVKLDPKRTPKQQVEWLFHQYRRMQRGQVIATQRLAKLDAEIEALQKDDATLPARVVREAKERQEPSVPYREYASSTGQRIWVGRGAAHNDTLTFKVARPHHLWLHARGVPGAHVVVPLEKKQVVDEQTLLDAAHLAFHHSDFKGERTGEVTYTHVKYVRKAGVPGAVTYTHDTTFWLRVEPARLERLTAQ